MMEEIYEFKHQKKKASWRLPIILLIVGLFLIGVSYFLLYSKFMKVNEFKIEGISTIDKNTLFGLLAAEVIRGESWRAFFGQDNLIFWLGVKNDSLKEKIPLLADLKLKTNLWEQRVEISVLERQFKGIWCLVKSQQCFIFDKEGVVFNVAPLAEGNLLLKVNDESNRSINLGQLVLPDFSWFEKMFIVLDMIKKEEMLPADIRIKDINLREWEAAIFNGPRFIFSFESIPENLSEIIKSLKNQLNFSKLYYIDFRIPGRIYYR